MTVNSFYKTNHFLVTIFQKLADARPFFGDDCKFLLRDRAFFGDYLPFLAVPWWFFAGAERFLGKNGELPRRVRATPSEEGELVSIFLTLGDLSDNSRPATFTRMREIFLESVDNLALPLSGFKLTVKYTKACFICTGIFTVYPEIIWGNMREK